MEITPGTIVGGKYRLEKPLSRGGMGSVWVARHATLGSPVAVKFMDPSIASSPEFVARFEREARIAANLQSPYVVLVQDHGIDDGVPYIIMELLQGESLSTHLRRVGRLSLQDAVRIFSQVAKAIRRAHDAGLVHRDLKPGNIFLARAEEDEEIVKVLDFGIVKETSSAITGESTRTGEILGSPNYMSPEQARGKKDLDHRSDLWSLGVILFHAITGEQPFASDQVGDVLAKIVADPIPKASRIAPDLPPALDDFFDKALSRDREQRFQSVRDMASELRRVAGLSPPISTPSSSQPDPAERTEAPITDRSQMTVKSGSIRTPEPPPPSAGTLTSAGAMSTVPPEGAKPPRSRRALAIVVALLVLGIGAAGVAHFRGGRADESTPADAPQQASEPVASPVPAEAPPPPLVESPAPEPPRPTTSATGSQSTPATAPPARPTKATTAAPEAPSPQPTTTPAPPEPEEPYDPKETPKPSDADEY